MCCENFDGNKCCLCKERTLTVVREKRCEFAIKPLSVALKSWLKRQATEEVTDEQGNIKTRMGKSAKDLLKKLKSGDASAVKRMKENTTVEERFRPDNCDLIVWFLVR